MSRALLQQAYLALTSAANNQGNVADYKNVADAIEQELAKQEFYPDWDTLKPYHERIAELEKELAKPWVGLTEDERFKIATEMGALNADWIEFAFEIEKHVRLKNK